MKNRSLMSEGNPFKAVIIFSIPSILAMLVNAIYNIVDKIFIGNFVSSEALGGLQVINPLCFLSFSLMVLFGVGASSYASNKLGEKKDKEANEIFNSSLFFGLFLVIIMSALFFIFRKSLVELCGASESTRSYAVEYLTTLIFGFPFQFIAYFFTMNIRSEGRPVVSMFAQITGCAINVILDAIFIVYFKWGVFGAAFATVLGNVSNFIVGIWFYFFSRKNYFKVDFTAIKHINYNHIFQVASIGASSAILNICNAFSTIIYNNVISEYAGALSVLAILNSIDSICILPCIGIRQGLLPLFGYNYGEKKYKRLFTLFYVGMLYSTIYGVFICSVIMLNPAFFANLFVDKKESAEIINRAIDILRFYPVGITIIGANMNVSALYQATREKIKAIILSLMRQCLYLVPLLYLFDYLFKESGVWYAMPSSDILAALSAMLFFMFTFFAYKKNGYLSKVEETSK